MLRSGGVAFDRGLPAAGAFARSLALTDFHAGIMQAIMHSLAAGRKTGGRDGRVRNRAHWPEDKRRLGIKTGPLDGNTFMVCFVLSNWDSRARRFRRKATAQ